MTPWDKQLVITLKKRGLSHEHAMIALGETAEHRQIAYQQGYNQGHNDGTMKSPSEIEAEFQKLKTQYEKSTDGSAAHSMLYQRCLALMWVRGRVESVLMTEEQFDLFECLG